MSYSAYAAEYVSPLQQWKQGLEILEYDCRDGRFLMINPENQKPACLHPYSSMIRFVENGWMPVRNLVLENPVETKTSGHGGEFTKQYFSFFEIASADSILTHAKHDESLTRILHVDDKIISNCSDTGDSSEVTVLTLNAVHLSTNSITFTEEKQTWPKQFCASQEQLIQSYYQNFFN